MEGMRTHLPIGRCRRSDEIHIVLVLIIIVVERWAHPGVSHAPERRLAACEGEWAARDSRAEDARLLRRAERGKFGGDFARR